MIAKDHMQKKLLLLFMLTRLMIAGAQDSVIPVGGIRHFSVSGQQLNITANNAYVRIQFYEPGVVRVRISRQPFPDDFSYAVIAGPGLSIPKPVDENGELTLKTDSLKVVIRKSPFSIRLLTPDGRTINEDEPGLATSWIGTEVTTYKHLQDGERFLGLGEKTGNLDRRGMAYTNWNSDVYGYSISADPLYSTIPFYIGVHHGLQYGVFLDNSFQSDFNFGASNDRFSSFGAKGGEMNYYLIYRSDVAGILESYTALTGRMNLPPLWSLGYQQNRYSYYPDTEVLRIARTLREKKIPADGITLDIHYMDAYKLFTWNNERFPDPKGMIDSLDKMGFKTTLIVDPGIKVEKNYPAYESGIQQDIFLKYSDGKPYTGEVWPGWCNFPDFTSEKGRAWWRSQITAYTNIGVAGIWNDMNEIATWGQKMPANVLFNYDDHPSTHLKGHNVFGLQMARSSYEATRQALQKRPFILTRAGFAGMQRYTALWTGDNRAEDDHMLAGVRLLASLGMSGVAFTGMDIGGFTGNPSPALYTRWMQLGAFVPYFRNHTALNTKSAEPWSFGEDVLEISRNYINLRYRLLPYLYSSFYAASQTGMPVVRSLAIDYTHDDKVYNPAFQNQYMFGSSLLIMPQPGTQTFAKIYFPAGDWYDLYSDVREKGNNEKLIELSPALLPVYAKAGSIIPEQSLIQHTGEKPTDTLLLHIYNGNAVSSFGYYEDDGISFRNERGGFYKRMIHFDGAGKAIRFDKATGEDNSRFSFIRLIMHGFDTAAFTVEGKKIAAETIQRSMFESVPPPSALPFFSAGTFVIKNTPDTIRISF
jgi:alpha-glucosidase